MQIKYNQFVAMMAIAKASFRSILRSPSAIVFSIGFPLIFILVFGFVGNNGGISLNVAFSSNTDTSNVIYTGLKSFTGFKFSKKQPQQVEEDLEKGRITAIIDIQKTADTLIPYKITLKSSEAVNPQNLNILQSILQSFISNINKAKYSNTASYATVDNNVKKIPGRIYRTIDFILPGQLGFSLLSAGVFGVAFLFYNLRQQLVLKRMYATPIKRSFIVIGEAISRVLFQLITAVIIILVGHFIFNFTLVYGVSTFLSIMVLCFLALIVFMGFGFIVSSLAKNESTIPPFANLFTLPQFLLAGTFFSIETFPKWLQPICNLLPLTHFNNAMRSIAFEGASLVSCYKEIGILLLWGIFVYTIAAKTFKWE